MRKRYIFFLLIGYSSFVFEAKAQIHIAGLRAIHLQTGIIDNIRIYGYDNRGYYMNFGYTLYRKNYSYFQAGFSLDRKNYMVALPNSGVDLLESGAYKAKTNRYLFEAVYHALLMKDHIGNFYLSGGGGGFFGYESINGDNKVLIPGNAITPAVELKGKSQFTYGLMASLETEYFLSQKTALTFQIREHFFIVSDVTHFHLYAGPGIKFIINPK